MPFYFVLVASFWLVFVKQPNAERQRAAISFPSFRVGGVGINGVLFLCFSRNDDDNPARTCRSGGRVQEARREVFVREMTECLDAT